MILRPRVRIPPVSPRDRKWRKKVYQVRSCPCPRQWLRRSSSFRRPADCRWRRPPWSSGWRSSSCLRRCCRWRSRTRSKPAFPRNPVLNFKSFYLSQLQMKSNTFKSLNWKIGQQGWTKIRIMCVRICVCIYACMYICMYVYMHVCMNECMFVCMHLCMYVCMYMCM